MATSRATWNLDWEGQVMLGYVGPDILPAPSSSRRARCCSRALRAPASRS